MDANRPTSADVPESGGVDLLGLARRGWWLVTLLVLLSVAGAAQYTRTQPKVYESSTDVLVQATGGGQDANVVGGRTRGEINLDTEAQLVRSTAVATGAAALLRSTEPAERLVRRISVEVPANTAILRITFADRTAAGAQAGSHAFAEAYLRNREETARGDLAEQIATLDEKLKQLNLTLSQVNGRLANLRQDSPERENLESQRTTTVSQINTLAGRLNQLTTTTLHAGKITTDANLPSVPTKPNRPVNLASGAMIGLLLGIGATLLRERLDRRVRRPADVTRRCDLAVLAGVPRRVRPRIDDVFVPFGTGGRIFNRLRNEVLASIPAPTTTHTALNGRIVVVAGASRGGCSTVVAANLAAAFARTGGETVLVSAHLPDSVVDAGSVHRMFGVPAIPGLSDVLAGRVPLRTATQRAPRHPNLHVVTTGGTASAGGLLQSQALRDTLATLRQRAAYIVVEAPSTATSADAQSLASLADAAIIAVELRRTRYAEVTDAVEQLRRVGTPVLGTVVLPRLAPADRSAASVIVATELEPATAAEGTDGIAGGAPPVQPPSGALLGGPDDATAILDSAILDSAVLDSAAVDAAMRGTLSNDDTVVTTRIKTRPPAPAPSRADDRVG